MVQKVFLNEWIYNALIKRNLNGFTVTELRDLIMAHEDIDLSKAGMSVFVRRQLIKLLERGYLFKQEARNPRKSKYFKTPLFVLDEFIPAARTKMKPSNFQDSDRFVERINHDREQSEAELTIILGEVEEYKRVLALYPEQHELIEPLISRAKMQSAELLGRINALSNLANQ